MIFYVATEEEHNGTMTLYYLHLGWHSVSPSVPAPLLAMVARVTAPPLDGEVGRQWEGVTVVIYMEKSQILRMTWGILLTRNSQDSRSSRRGNQKCQSENPFDVCYLLMV